MPGTGGGIGSLSWLACMTGPAGIPPGIMPGIPDISPGGIMPGPPIIGGGVIPRPPMPGSGGTEPMAAGGGGD